MDTDERMDSLPPIPVEDFERRLRACREMGVRELHDGQLHVLFDPRPARLSPAQETLALIDRARIDASVRYPNG